MRKTVRAAQRDTGKRTTSATANRDTSTQISPVVAPDTGAPQPGDQPAQNVPSAPVAASRGRQSVSRHGQDASVTAEKITSATRTRTARQADASGAPAHKRARRNVTQSQGRTAVPQNPGALNANAAQQISVPIPDVPDTSLQDVDQNVPEDTQAQMEAMAAEIEYWKGESNSIPQRNSYSPCTGQATKRARPAQPAATIPKPKGSAGGGKRGYCLIDEMGLNGNDEDRAIYSDIRVRTNIVVVKWY